MAYTVCINFDDGTEEYLDETFKTEKAADKAARQWASDYSQGGDCLREAGKEACDAEVIGWDIMEE